MMSKTRQAGTEGPSFIERARREQIVRCAIETIAELGYSQTTLERIAQRAGVSRGVISYHFSGRDEVIREVVNELYASGHRYIGPRMMAATSCRDKIAAYIQAKAEFMRESRAEILAVKEVCQGQRPVDGTGSEEILVERELTILETILRHGQELGEFRDFDARLMAVTVHRSIDGLVQECLGRDDEALTASARELIRTFDHAMRAEGSPSA